MLKISNTLKRKKEKFIPQGNNVKMYACGVTVYDHCHIGHGRSLYTFEVIRRYLEYKGFNVKFVRNITDIDDKIINRAKVLSKSKNVHISEAFDDIRNTYIDSYYKDLASLNIPKASIEPKATDNIPHMINFIQGLIKKKMAYQKEDGVYFSVRKFPSYGKLSGKKIDELESSARIDPSPYKKDVLDFALWKAKKNDEPFWESPFGRGRPGWHIECSTMSKRFLSDTLDIHGGGRDLIFPHHENEIAQSESLTGKQFALYWIHHGLITINGEKMAKSLGNFYTLKDILNRYHNEDLKLFYLSAHYSSPLDFSLDKLSEFTKQRQKLYVIYDYIRDAAIKPLKNPDLLKIKGDFEKAMDDDFNFSVAKGALFALYSFVSSRRIRKEILGEVKNIFLSIGKVLILFEENESVSKDLKQYIKDKIKERNVLREQKKYNDADTIRNDLLNKGIILEDLQGSKTVWRIKR